MTKATGPAMPSLTCGPYFSKWMAPRSERIYVFVTAADGNLYARFWNGSAWVWGNVGRPAPGMAGDPSAVAYRMGNQGRINVFVRGLNGELQEAWLSDASPDWSRFPWTWSVRGNFGGIALASSPEAVTWLQSGVRRLHVAQAGVNGQAFANEWDGSRWRWTPRGTPS